MKEQITSFFKKIYEWFTGLHYFYQLAVFFFFFLALNVFLVGTNTFSSSAAFIEGKPAPSTVVSPRNVEVKDVELTAQRKQEARESVEPVYELDPTSEIASRKKLDEVIELLGMVRSGETSVTSAVAQLESAGITGITAEQLGIISQMRDEQFDDFANTMRSTLATLFALQIKPDELGLASTKARDILAASGLPTEVVDAASSILSGVLLPNYLPNEEKTRELQQQAEEAAGEVVIRKQKGEVITRQGEVVTREQLLVLEALNLLEKGPDPVKIIGLILLVAGVQLFLLFYLRFFQHQSFIALRKVVLMFTLVSLVNVFARALAGSPYQYLIPLPFGVIVANLMLGWVDSVGTFITSLLLLSLYPEASVLQLSVLSGLAVIALFLTRDIRMQTHLLRSGIMLALSGLALGLVFALYFKLDLQGGVVFSGEITANGFLSVVLALGFVPFFESLFHITTSIRLIELATPNHPLLKELMSHAPGTYSHSILTASLAEAAAEELKANPLLVRAASYFHDIGKMKRPLFFSENQQGVKNPHDETNPSLSRLIIESHVKEGVELAREHNLPREIIDIIAQHHGTTLMKPFYVKATENGNEVSEEEYRYDGEKPKTKEAAIVMLADSVEAAVRSINKRTPERIEKVVRTVIKGKLEDGQLDESPLTFQDLEKITGAFVKVLSGMYHNRVEYPEKEKGDE